MGTISDTTAVLERPPAIISTTDATGTITEFHITGFGPFHSVPVNPTQQIVEALPNRLNRRPLQNTILASTQILEVSAEATREKIVSMYKSLDQPTHPMLKRRIRSDRRIIFIHLGINAGVKSFQLEVQGRNEATFSCPDQKGWTPIKQPIDEHNPDLEYVCRTTLRLDMLVKQLSERGYGVELSTDAGRFVCNWLYYNSLQLAEKASACALFVHVPPTSVVPLQRQIEFLCELLECISMM